MAVSANAVFEVRTGGDDDNGGGFVTGASGTDYSQQDSAQATLTTASVVHSTTTQINLDAGDHTVSANDVGNLLQITGGTATAGIYQITAADVGNNRWTLDRSAGTAAQTVVGAMGGAFATPGKLTAAITVARQRAWIKSGTYTLSTSTPGPGGPVGPWSNIAVRVEGYETTRGDRGAKPRVDAGSQTSISIFTLTGASYNDKRQAIVNVIADGNSQSGVVGFLGVTSNRSSRTIDCEAVDCAVGFDGNYTICTRCSTEGCTTGFDVNHARYCEAVGGTTGFTSPVNYSIMDHCIARDQSGDGFANGGIYANEWNHCLAENCGGNGFDWGSYAMNAAFACLAVNCGGYGFDTHASYEDDSLVNCAGYNNTSGNHNQSSDFATYDFVALTADPFVDAASHDYRLNNTAGGGAELRGIIGAPNQTAQLDIGPAQHADPAGGNQAKLRRVMHIGEGVLL